MEMNKRRSKKNSLARIIEIDLAGDMMNYYVEETFNKIINLYHPYSAYQLIKKRIANYYMLI